MDLLPNPWIVHLVLWEKYELSKQGYVLFYFKVTAYFEVMQS